MIIREKTIPEIFDLLMLYIKSALGANIEYRLLLQRMADLIWNSIKPNPEYGFLNLRDSSNVPKTLRGWMSPDGIMELLEKNIEAGNQALQQMPYDLLRDKDGLNLRDYQIKTIQAAEKATVEGKKTVLLAMATGTGKTRTVLGMIYRFLTTNRFKRILFLVDRTALGE